MPISAATRLSGSGTAHYRQFFWGTGTGAAVVGGCGPFDQSTATRRKRQVIADGAKRILRRSVLRFAQPVNGRIHDFPKSSSPTCGGRKLVRNAVSGERPTRFIGGAIFLR